jgi:hypothetical protein
MGPDQQQEGEGEERNGARGPAREKGKWAEPEGIESFLIYSNKFQTSLNCFEQNVDYQAPKIPNKIWLEIV